MARPKKGTKSLNNGYLFTDFSKGLYLLDTPRAIGEQLYSLAMTGGRNCWSEKGALVNQYGYVETASIPEEDPVIAYSRIAAGNNNFFLITLQGHVYLYTTNEGLKQFKTMLPSDSSAITARRGKDLITTIGGSNYLFGNFYDASESVEIMSIDDMSKFASYYTFNTSEDNLPFFWSDKQVAVNDEQFIIISATQDKEQRKDKTCTIKLAPLDASTEVTAPYTISEKTKLEVSFVFKPENEEPDTGGTVVEKPNVTIVPQLMEVSQNRLFVQHTDGTIYYSAIGLTGVDEDVQQTNVNFSESAGAGYFQGYYNDTTKTLAIEDFLSGTLIVKESGFYYLTITTTQTAMNSYIYTVNIEKVSNCGQKYATDHVIVQEKVYAFDTNTGTIVNALGVNVFGNMVSGKPVISAEYINAQNSGINDTKRCLVYNSSAEVFILYYGENLNNGLVLTNQGTLFPRQLDKQVIGYVGLNQGVVGISRQGTIFQDFEKQSIIPNISSIVEFEPIGIRDNRLICSTIIEITELNGISYNLTTSNAGSSYQKITPSFDTDMRGVALPPMLYSDLIKNTIYDSYSIKSKWADKKSNVTRVSAPMSGREGVTISLEFPANVAFCVSAIRFPDMSQGE